ncbi:MAG: hypothetical protein QM669_10275, partial [Siphonobacter sp.]
QIILDAKYYTETFQRNFNARKIHSAHLYQLFAYLKNHPSQKNLSGILVYPTVTQKVSAVFSDNQHRILVQTVNLNQSWQAIHESLLTMVQY